MKDFKQKTVTNTKTSYESYINRRISCSLTLLPMQTKRRFARLVQTWVDANGEIYTVKRLKDVKQIILNSYNESASYGKMMVIDQSEFMSTIATKRGGKWLMGTLGTLHKLCFRNAETMGQVIQLLHSYTLCMDENVTSKDIVDLKDIIEPSPSPQAIDFITQFCNKISAVKLQKSLIKCMEHTCIEGDSKESINELRGMLSREINLPIPYSLVQPKLPHENKDFFAQYVRFNRSPIGLQIYQELPDLWSECFPMTGTTPVDYKSAFNSEFIFSVGAMKLINEPGLKKRWVQNTRYIFQYIFEPFGNRLYDLIRLLPWDCTHSEQLGIDLIQAALRAGKLCHSIDLSKATDKFPMLYNVAVLKKLLIRCKGASALIDAFNVVASAPVDLPVVEGYSETGCNTTRWGTGQPMGAYPSFAMLSLVHGLILFILNGYKHNGDFVIHGDDVVIFNDELKTKYIQFLCGSDMDFSPYKTITGTAFAEINSKLVFVTSVITPVKWKRIDADNCISVAPFWGMELISKLGANRLISAQDIKHVLALPYPFGVGMNPAGETLDVRFARFPGLIESSYSDPKTPEQFTFRDLVIQRYSRFAINSEKELDYAWYHAMLLDLVRAENADKHFTLKNLNINNPQLVDWRFISDCLTHEETLSVSNRPRKILEITKSQEKRKKQRSHLQSIMDYHYVSGKKSGI